MQTWPQLEKPPKTIARAVRSTSASLQAMSGALPPSSITHGMSRSPHAAATRLPGRDAAGEDQELDARVDERGARRARSR